MLTVGLHLSDSTVITMKNEGGRVWLELRDREESCAIHIRSKKAAADLADAVADAEMAMRSPQEVATEWWREPLVVGMETTPEVIIEIRDSHGSVVVREVVEEEH
jgi:hypothetical protein